MIEETIHATTVCVDGKGVLITGPSGIGKSQLALCLIRRAKSAGIACGIIADDRTIIERDGEQLIARVPKALAGLVEVRGYGIVRLGDAQAERTKIALHVDLVKDGAVRMHDGQTRSIEGVELPSLALPGANIDSSASAIFAALGHPVWI